MFDKDYICVYNLINFMKILFVVFFIFISFLSYGQAGVIKGSVKNQKTNESIVNSKIILIMNDTITKILKTDLEGCFVLKGIEPGKYRIKVIVDNYKEIVKKKVFVEDVRTCFLTLPLKPN